MRAALDRKRLRKNFYWEPDKVAPMAPPMRDEKGRQRALRHKASHDAYLRWQASQDEDMRIIYNTVHRDASSYQQALREQAAQPKVIQPYAAPPLPHETARLLKDQAHQAIHKRTKPASH